MNRFEILHRYSHIMETLEEDGGMPFFVGGIVRDLVMQENHPEIPVQFSDVDIEVFRMNIEAVGESLRKMGNAVLVGNGFPVWQLTLPDGEVVDIALPRRESKQGLSHSEFQTVVDPNMSLQDAASRRDFTINAMYMDNEGVLTHSERGLKDIEDLILRPVGPAFGDDPLRVLRGMQFSSRFNLDLSPAMRLTSRLLLPQVYLGPKREGDSRNYLAFDRVWKEWKKALNGHFVDRIMSFLIETDWDMLWPVLPELWNTKQDPEWHPETNVAIHSTMALCEMMFICERENITGEDRNVLMLAAFTHDFGKTVTTGIREDGHVASPGHAHAGVPIVRDFLENIGAPVSVIVRVLPLVQEHMSHIDLNKNGSNAAIRGLARRLAPANMQELVWLAEADGSGRWPKPHVNPAQFLIERSVDLGVEKGPIIPLLKGRDLITEGIATPGPLMGRLLKRAEEAQENGIISTKEEALEFLRNPIVGEV